MGIEHIILKVKHIFPTNRISSVLCSLPFFSRIIAVTIDMSISIKTAMMKSQNKIIVGVFSINNISLISISQTNQSHW